MKIGDQINITKYTATCQKIDHNIAVFCMDQYLDENMAMNGTSYEESKLRKRINSSDILKMFDFIRPQMVPFDNGDYLHIPYAEELFDPSEIKGLEEKHADIVQWDLMKDRRNVVCFRENEFSWGWCMNVRDSSDLFNRKKVSYFAGVTSDGYSAHYDAGYSGGVRLVFQLNITNNEIEKPKIPNGYILDLDEKCAGCPYFSANIETNNIFYNGISFIQRTITCRKKKYIISINGEEHMGKICEVMIEASEHFAKLNNLTIEKATSYVYGAGLPVEHWLRFNDYCKKLEEKEEEA